MKPCAFLTLLSLLSALVDHVELYRSPKSERARADVAEVRKEAIPTHGLDQPFDVLAAPPRRLSIRQEAQLQLVAEIPLSEAPLEGPPLGHHPSDHLRFTDGSWLTLITDEERSEIHMHLMQQPGLGARTRR